MSETQRIIASSDRESNPTREQREKEKLAEKAKEKSKEKLKTREKLDRGVLELKKLLETLPKNSKERARVEHTIGAIENSLKNLGKDGAPKDKRIVKMLNHEGKQAKWPNGEVAIQNEGVPVDELIALLKSQAQELAKKLPTKADMDKKKKERDEMWERYRLAKEVVLKDKDHDKSWLYSQWEKMKKELESMEEARDKGFVPEAKEMEEIANDLYAKSKSYFESHYGHELPLSKEESDRQNVRTTYEAYLINKDYRKTDNEEEDYKVAMEAMRVRRELNLEEEEEPPMAEPEPPKTEEQKPPQEPKATTEPEPTPTKKVEKLRVPERVALVKAEDQVELMAQERGAKRLNELLNNKSRVKKWWYRAFEQGYREQLIDEERKKILGEASKPSWIRKKLFGAKETAKTGKKNLFEGTGNEAEHRVEMTALADRFSQGYYRQSEGEQREQLTDPEFSKQLNDLVHEYATGTMSDIEFETKKETLIFAIAKKYPESYAAGKLTADNFLEAAKDYRKIYLHAQGLAREEVNLQIDLGLAKRAVKTQASLGAGDKVVGFLQKYTGITPTTAGFAISIGSYFVKKPLYWLGGAAGLGGALGAMRKNTEQKRDLEMHRIERAMGTEISEFGSDATRRQEAEKFVYEMKGSRELALEVENLQQAFEASPTPENAQALTLALAEAEARHSLSESRQKDLISFEGETSLERSRLVFMKTLAEAKVALQKAGFASNIPACEEYKTFMETLGGGMDKIDKDERFKRWKANVKAAVVGAISGLVVGGAVQEGFAWAGDGLHSQFGTGTWDILRPGGKATSAEKLYSYLGEKTGRWNFDITHATGGSMVDLAMSPGGNKIRIDSSIDLVKSGTTNLWNAVDRANPSLVLAQFDIDPTTGNMQPIPGSFDSNAISFRETAVTGGRRSIADVLNSGRANFGANAKLSEIHFVENFDNNTPLPKVELNELKFYMDYDSDGNLVMDASKLEEYLEDNFGDQLFGSRHGDTALDVAESFKDGSIKIGIGGFNPKNPSQCIELTLGSDHKFHGSAGTDLRTIFGTDSSGRPVLKGEGFLSVFKEVGARADGSKEAWSIAAIRGDGSDIDYGAGQSKSFEVARKAQTDWWGPYVQTYPGRKPLEVLRGRRQKDSKEGSKNTHADQSEKAKSVDYGDYEEENNDTWANLNPRTKPSIRFSGEAEQEDAAGIFEDDVIEDQKEKETKLTGKVKLGIRGQKIKADSSSKDFGKDWPEKFKFATSTEMAELLVDQNFFGLAGDLKAMQGMTREQKVKFLTEILEKRKVDLTDDVKFKDLKSVAETTYQKVNEILQKYSGKGRSEMPDISKVHVVNIYEFQARARRANKQAAGVSFVTNGEMFINYDFLKDISADSNQLAMNVKQAIAHELVHLGSATNYWAFQTSEPNTEAYGLRRTGLRMGKIQNVNNPSIFMKQRGVALNEGVTEMLSREVLNEIYKQDGKASPREFLNAYPDELQVVNLLAKKFEIPFETLAQAVVSRRSLGSLVEKLDGGLKAGKRERPQYTALLMAVMDAEFYSNKDYTVTKQLIAGQKGITISREIKQNFPTSLLDSEGNIKQSIVEAYGLVEQATVANGASPLLKGILRSS